MERMNGPGPDEVMAVVARRGNILRALDSDGAGKRDLVEELDVSRSTIDRGIRELESVGFVERNGSAYHQTLVGELALAEYEAFASRIDGIVRSAEVLAALPPGTDVDPVLLDGVSIVRAEPHSPHQPVTAVCQLIEEANSVWITTPAVFPQAVESCRKRLVDGDLRADIVTTDQVVTRLVGQHGDALSEGLATGRLTIRQTDSPLQYGLILAERDEGEIAGLLVIGDSGARAFLINDDPRAVEWVRNRLLHYWKRATPLGAAGSGGEQSTECS